MKHVNKKGQTFFRLSVLTAFLGLLLTSCASQARDKQPAVMDGLRLQGWTAWGNMEAAAEGNAVTLNGNITDAAGYLSTHVDTALRNKTVVLEVQNAAESVFSEERLLKITANSDDRLIYPANVNVLIHGEYVPITCDRIEFIVPGDFDGKLGLVFYKAELKDLKITAYYR